MTCCGSAARLGRGGDASAFCLLAALLSVRSLPRGPAVSMHGSAVPSGRVVWPGLGGGFAWRRCCLAGSARRRLRASLSQSVHGASGVQGRSPCQCERRAAAGKAGEPGSIAPPIGSPAGGVSRGSALRLVRTSVRVSKQPSLCSPLVVSSSWLHGSLRSPRARDTGEAVTGLWIEARNATRFARSSGGSWVNGAKAGSVGLSTGSHRARVFDDSLVVNRAPDFGGGWRLISAVVADRFGPVLNVGAGSFFGFRSGGLGRLWRWSW